MQYYFYLDGVLMPVTPSAVKMSSKNKNKIYDLANGGEVNITNLPGLISISFDLLLPNDKYPFSLYSGEFKEANYYLDLIKNLKNTGKPFEFMIIRTVTSQTAMKFALRQLSYSENMARDITGNSSGKITSSDARKILINEQGGNQTVISDTTMTVTLEKYEVTEDAEKYGRDFLVSVELLQYEALKSKTVVLKRT